jgi:HK97 family phage portal protein
MTLRTKTVALARKAVALVSTIWSPRDIDTYRNGAGVNPSGIAGYSGTADAAMQLSVVFACVKLISETVATLPLIVYRRKPRGRAVAADHPLYALLHDSPNADQTAVEFWEMVVAHIALRGRAYVLKSVDVNGDVFDLRPLNPDRMGEVRMLANGGRLYRYNHPTRGLVEYSERDIWEPRGFGGLSVVQYGARSMAAASNAEMAASDLYGNDMKPRAVITRDDFLTKDQRRQAKEAIEDGMMKGAGGVNLRLIEGGMKYQQLSLSPEDAQLLETRQYSVEDLCRWFGMNPAMIGHGTSVSNWGTGREQINLAFLQYVLRAYTKRLEQGITKWLLRTEERRKFYAEFSVEGLLRADSAGRATFYSTMVQNGIMTRNEVRDLENLDAMDGGHELTIQSNLIPATLLGQGTTSTDAIDALKRALGIEDKNNVA